MYRVKIINNINSRRFEGNFETELEANKWIDSQVAKESWGRLDRWERFGFTNEIENTPETGYTNSRQGIYTPEVLGNDGFTVIEPVTYITEYLYPTEFTIYGPTADISYDRLKVAQEEAATFKKFRDFGETIELYFTSLINKRPITQLQKDAIQVDPEILAIMGELRFGRVSKAKTLIESVTTDEELYFSSDIATISTVMQDFLDGLV